MPTLCFDGRPIYRDDATPDEAEIHARRKAYFEPYHAALAQLIEDTIARHGYALLWDAHSIAPVVPRLFPGTLPDLNLGSNGGQSCAPEIESEVVVAMADQVDYTHVVNGRFRGGWITRHYGRPDRNAHALQMELSQATHLSGTPPRLAEGDRTSRLKVTLERLMHAALNAAQRLYGDG